MKKKILLILLALFTFGLMTNVNASSFYSERIEDIRHHKQTLKRNEYKVANIFRERGTDNLAYCIEPFIIIDESTEYTEYPYQDQIFGYTSEQIDRINDIAYFGYGYGDHTDVKWISISQILIWRTVNPNDTFEWVDDFSARNPIDPYRNEINELENLIETKNTTPSFVNGETINMYNHLELVDSNNVLANYEIKTATGINATKDGNKLILDRIDGSDTGEVTLFKKGSDEKGKFYYHATSQNILVRGGASDVEAKINIQVLKGSISVKKVDKDLNKFESRGEAILGGATFELFDEEDNKISDISLDENGEGIVNNLYLGKYILKEKTPGIGYRLDDSSYEIELNDENVDFEITIKNKVIESKLKILKLYGSKSDLDNNTMAKEQGVSFDVFDKDDNLIDTITTDENGECEVLLPYGTYKIVQKNTTANYQMVDDKTVEVNETSSDEILLELYDVEIEVPNANINTTLYSNLFNICQTLVNS